MTALLVSWPAHAVTLVVKLMVKHSDEVTLNKTIAQPAGLRNGHSYHVTLGFVEGVPKNQAKKLKKQLYTFLRHAHNAKKDPVRFNVKNATTWGMLHIPYYNANAVIIVPSNPLIFVSLNAKLAAYLKPLNSKGIHLDVATSPVNYMAHITMQSPKTTNPAAFAAQAVKRANQAIQNNPLTLHLNEYRISIQ